MELVTLQDISVTKQDKAILDMSGSDISFQQGDKIGIIGGNGSGKTTLIRVLLNLVSYQGIVTRHIQPEEIGVQMQNNAFSDLMKVKEIISLVCNRSIRDSDIQEAIEHFNLHPLLPKKLANLSGGEKQRLTIFLVVFNDPRMFIFDEITSGLDFDNREAIIKLIHELPDEKTLLMVSHYFEEIEKLADKVLMLHEGKLLAFDALANLYEDYSIHSTIGIDRERDGIDTDLRSVRTADQKIYITSNRGEEETLMESLREQEIPFTYKPRDLRTLYTHIRERARKVGV